MTEFQGYAPETFDFLWGIRLNNNRDWFTEHKKEYQEYLYEPTKALGAQVFEPFRDTPGMVCKVSRIYRDMRMPQPNGPYKESLWISLRQDAFYWGEHPCLYFEIRPEAAGYGFVNWRPNTATLKRYREDLKNHPDRFRTLVETCEKKTGFTLQGDEYKKRWPSEDPRNEALMNKKSFLLDRDVAPGPELFTPALVDRVIDAFRNLMPLYNYFMMLESEGE